MNNSKLAFDPVERSRDRISRLKRPIRGIRPRPKVLDIPLQLPGKSCQFAGKPFHELLLVAGRLNRSTVPDPDLPFQIISRRYDRGSVVLVTNKVFTRLPSIFSNDGSLASAILDRLFHHADTIIVESKSYHTKNPVEPLPASYPRTTTDTSPPLPGHRCASSRRPVPCIFKPAESDIFRPAATTQSPRTTPEPEFLGRFSLFSGKIMRVFWEDF